MPKIIAAAKAAKAGEEEEEEYLRLKNRMAGEGVPRGSGDPLHVAPEEHQW